MQRFKSSLLVLTMAAVCLAQGTAPTSSPDGTNPLANPRVRHIGDNMLCKCGCGNSVTSCNMLHCEFSEPMRAKIAGLVAQGKSDGDIWDALSKEYGKDVILTPPSNGFFLMNWAMPFLALTAGFGVLWMFIKRQRRQQEAKVFPVLPAEVLSRYQAQIEKEVSKID